MPTKNATYDRWFFMIVFLILGFSLLQIFLSIIGTVLSFVWSPCCQSSYKPLKVTYNLLNRRKILMCLFLKRIEIQLKHHNIMVVFYID